MFESKINRGKANGYAPLDGSGKVPLDKLPPIQSTINTGSFATTGSNIFTGNQIISGSEDNSLTIGEVNTIAGPSFGLRVSGSDGAPLFVTSDGTLLIGAITNPTNISDDTSFFANQLISFPVSDGPTAAILVQKSGSLPSNWVFDYDGKSYFPSDITIGYNSLGSGLTSGSLNITKGNINVSGSVNISSSLVVSSTIVNNGNIEALNSDLIIDGGDIYLTGSLLMTGSITLNGVTYTSLTGSGGTGGESGTSGTSGESGTSGTSGESGTSGTSGISGTSGTSGTSILLDSTLTFEGNIISGSSIPQIGTKITISTAYDASTSMNGNGVYVTDNAETSLVQTGWIIRFYNGTTRTVVNVTPSNLGQPFRAFEINPAVDLNPAYPLTIESQDYAAAVNPSVELKIGDNRWIFDTSGSINLTGSINGARNLVTTASLNNFTGSVVTTASFNSYTASVGSLSTGSLVTTASFNSYTASVVIVNTGSLVTTSSFNAYTASVGSVSTGSLVTTSSFNTLTSSFNTFSSSINTFSASVNTTTASLNSKTGSYATTGSNQFNGNQSITGSLFVSSTAISNATLLASSSNLTLNSGSNFYIQNNGVAEITGSLRVSGSLALTGSINISSGSIIMPNRPAFRVIGAGGPTTAVTVLSGSMTIVDFNQGNHFNTTTGLFTAPIAGLYQVNLVVRTHSNTNSTINQAIVYKSGSGGDVPQIMVEFGTNTTMNHTGGSTISRLAVGETLRAVIAVGTASFDGNDNFSVAYIG